MKPSQISTLIKFFHETNNLRPLYLVGSPGLGKTQCIQGVAKDLGIPSVLVHAPTCVPEDIAIPSRSPDGGLEFVVSNFLPFESSKTHPERGILIIDELPQAQDACQKMLANLVHERCVYGHALKAGWTIVATGNRQTDGAGASKILTHLQDRITPIDFEFDFANWIEWCVRHDVSEEVIAFANFRPDLVNTFDNTKKLANFATPRSWVDGVSRPIRDGIDASLLPHVIKGAVGEGPALEFIAFLSVYKELPDVSKILETGNGEIPKKIAVLWATIAALSRRVTPKTFGACCKYLKKLAETDDVPGREMSVAFMTMLDARPDHEKLKKSSGYTDAFNLVAPLLQAS